MAPGTSIAWGTQLAPALPMPRALADRLNLTLAWRRGTGCGRTGGLAIWLWSGRWLVTSHVILARCFHRMNRDLLPNEACR